MNLSIAATLTAAGLLTVWLYGGYQYNRGWDAGRLDLVTEQTQKAQAELAKKTQRQQQDDTKASVADTEGKQVTETITREVIKYIKTPGRSVCTYDDARVLLKSRAVSNANSIPGFDTDDSSVQTGTAK